MKLSILMEISNLEYNTNMSNLPKRVLDMWTQFKQVRVGASMDGMGETVEYQRWP